MGGNYSFTVNGVMRSTSEDKPLLRHLREDLHLRSAKDGCSEGVCGTCTVVVDGKTVKSYILTTKRTVDKNIITTKGSSDTEKEAFVYAFGAMESVQCRFYTPGMVMAGKALTDRAPGPIEEEIKFALRGNICRRTGYKKIIEGVQLIAAVLRGDAKIEESLEEGDSYSVGEHTFRLDVREKILGYGEYPGDVEMEGMACASTVYSKYFRAKVLDTNPQEAMALLGVLTVLIAEDMPSNKMEHLQQDWDVIIVKGDITRCVSDAICLVVAETRDILEDTKKLAGINYKEPIPVCSIHEAMVEDAPKMHEKGSLCQSRHMTRGDAKKALENSKYVVTQTYTTPLTEYGFLEPGCAVAFPYKDGVKVYSSDQDVCDTRKEIPIMLGWDPDRIVVESKLVDGGFDGKEDASTQHIAALAALRVQRPAKVIFSRQKSINLHPRRHATEGTFTLGYDENGIFIGLNCEIYFDTGVYASLCGSMPKGACAHSIGPYCYQNVGIRRFGYYTNNPPTGALQGFGVYQSEFTLESNINLLTERMSISPREIRYRSATEPGKVLPDDQITDCSTALKEIPLVVKDTYENNQGRAGVACTTKNAGVGVGLPDKERVKLKVHNDRVELYAATSDIDQGRATVFVQMVAEVTGLKKRQVKNIGANSEVVPDSGTISDSRQILITDEVVRMAVVDILEALKEAGGDISQLERREFFTEFLDPTNKLRADVPSPGSHVAYDFATHVVTPSDEEKVKEVYVAHDSGRVVSPVSIQGQTEGGVLMGLGYTLTKDLLLRNGVPQAKYSALDLMRFTQIPDIHTTYVEKKE